MPDSRDKPVAGELLEAEFKTLARLATGDTIVYSQDGDNGWFTRGDRAFIGDEVISLRKRGFITHKLDPKDETDNYRGMAEFDCISDAGLIALEAELHARNREKAT